MAFETPHDVIKKLQITLRYEANLSSYDPDDPSLPNLPSIEQSISELDPSPPYLRCEQCRAKLLRGSWSLSCVFCGLNQPQNLPPEPINFNSTSGRDWFLKHLDLNPSDMVELSMKAIDSSRRKTTKNEEIRLSDVLDLEIKWFVVSENHEITSEASLQAKSSLNSVGINLDNYFSDANTDTPSSNGNTLHGEGNVSLFESVRPSEKPGGSAADKSDMSFSGWQAEFQPASTGTLREELKSVAGSINEVSVNMDAVFGSTKDATIPSTSNTSDFFQDDSFCSSNSINASDGGKVETANNSSSMSVNWIEDGKCQSSDHHNAVSNTVYEDDGSFDVWNDFTSSTTAQDAPNSLFSTTTVPRDSFSEPEFFSGQCSKQRGLSGDTNTEYEAADTNWIDGRNADAANILPMVDYVEALISEMRDLSFMLDSNLSIPPKLDRNIIF